MKKSTYKISFLLLATALVFTACEKDFDSINDNPNRPSDAPTSYLLTAAEKGLMDNTSDAFWGCQVGGQLAQHWSSNNYSSESRYQFRTGVTNGYWSLLYAGGNNDAGNQVGGVVDLMRIIDLCETEPDKYSSYGDPANQIAVAKILKVWTMQQVTDIWGDVPYSEAWDALNNSTPKYDSQESIYTSLLADLNEAIAAINNEGAGPTGDVIYYGDMGAWSKFANSLKVRVAMRIADRKPDVASAAVNEAVAAGVFTSNADNALFPYSTIAPSYNMIYFNRYLDGRRDYSGSNVLVDTMKALNDYRLPGFVNPATATGEFNGEVYGLSEANAASTLNNTVSQFSTKMLAADFPGIYMQNAEVQFMLAEAVERGFIGGSAEEFYNAGIASSFEYWATDETAADAAVTYIAQPGVNYAQLSAAGKSWKEIIGMQKWLSLYTQGMQAWTEWRRLDFGLLQRPADGELDGDGIPNRLKYPVDEQLVNGDNYGNAISQQGPDLLATKVWWDMN
jgi:Starch-binding associating with outer membrane